MRTLRLAFSRLHQSNGAPQLMPGLPCLVLADVRHHVRTAQGSAELADFTDAPPESTPEELVRRVLARVETGRINWGLETSTRAFVAGSATIESVSLSDLAEPIELHPQHAIVIELVGEDDTPIAGAQYEITFPNGSLRTGFLNAAGRAEFHSLTDPRECEVCFPALDKDAWEYIQSSPL